MVLLKKKKYERAGEERDVHLETGRRVCSEMSGEYRRKKMREYV